MTPEELVQLVAVEVVVGALIAVSAAVGMARSAWREAAAWRGRHDQLADAIRDAGWWLT